MLSQSEISIGPLANIHLSPGPESEYGQRVHDTVKGVNREMGPIVPPLNYKRIHKLTHYII